MSASGARRLSSFASVMLSLALLGVAGNPDLPHYRLIAGALAFLIVAVVLIPYVFFEDQGR